MHSNVLRVVHNFLYTHYKLLAFVTCIIVHRSIAPWIVCLCGTRDEVQVDNWSSYNQQRQCWFIIIKCQCCQNTERRSISDRSIEIPLRLKSKAPMRKPTRTEPAGSIGNHEGNWSAIVQCKVFKIRPVEIDVQQVQQFY